MTPIRTFKCTQEIAVGPKCPPIVLAGPCVIENLEICRTIASRMKTICASLDLPYVFKASFDKANRTSVDSFRGPGLEQGLEILARIKEEFSLPVVTDIHEPSQAARVAEVADIIQLPAFLCRQTDLLVAAGETGRTINVKKGQFLAPEDMASVIGKIETTGNRKIMLTERGSTFGYHNLVVDMRGLVTMGGLGVPVVFDGTHSVQLPGGGGTCSGGQREFVAPLVRAATAVGIQGLFMEVHPEPEKALCDGANSLPLDQVGALLKMVKDIHGIIN